MKRLLTIAGLTVLCTAPAAAQFFGMPVWNSPKGGSGVTLNADMGLPSAEAGKGTAFGGRATLGLANLSITAGIATWTPEALDQAVTSFGGGAAFRVIGGSLMPVAINLIAGVAHAAESGSGISTVPATTNIVAGAGLSAGLPTPGISIEPYVSLTNLWSASDGDTDSRFGVTFGANLGFGLFGVHLAYDTASQNGASSSVFGLGAHFSLRPPLGM